MAKTFEKEVFLKKKPEPPEFKCARCKEMNRRSLKRIRAAPADANLRDTALCVISFMSTMSPIHAQRSITYSLLPRDELLIPKVIDRPPR